MHARLDLAASEPQDAPEIKSAVPPETPLRQGWLSKSQSTGARRRLTAVLLAVECCRFARMGR
eukprot:6190805-Pleurochrysis_carterae.AAC.1